MGVIVKSGVVLMRGGAVVQGCGSGCPTLQATFSFVGSGGTPFVDITLTWSATAVGGVSPGWRYAGGDLEVCDAGAGPSLKLREIVFWCSGTTWNAEIVVLFNGIQDSYSTVGGTLTPFGLTSASSPRVWSTAATGTSLTLCDFGSGTLSLDVAVVP